MADELNISCITTYDHPSRQWVRRMGHGPMRITERTYDFTVFQQTETGITTKPAIFNANVYGRPDGGTIEMPIQVQFKRSLRWPVGNYILKATGPICDGTSGVRPFKMQAKFHLLDGAGDNLVSTEPRAFTYKREDWPHPFKVSGNWPWKLFHSSGQRLKLIAQTEVELHFFFSMGDARLIIDDEPIQNVHVYELINMHYPEYTEIMHISPETIEPQYLNPDVWRALLCATSMAYIWNLGGDDLKYDTGNGNSWFYTLPPNIGEGELATFYLRCMWNKSGRRLKCNCFDVAALVQASFECFGMDTRIEDEVCPSRMVVVDQWGGIDLSFLFGHTEGTNRPFDRPDYDSTRYEFVRHCFNVMPGLLWKERLIDMCLNTCPDSYVRSRGHNYEHKDGGDILMPEEYQVLHHIYGENRFRAPPICLPQFKVNIMKRDQNDRPPGSLTDQSNEQNL